MFKQDVNIIANAIDLHWDLPDPVTLTDSLTRGVTADVWLVEDGSGSRYVAKFAYAGQAEFEAGLQIAEHIERRTGLLTGCPKRNRTGRLSVMLPSVPGEQHPLALLTYVDGTDVEVDPSAAAALLAHIHSGLIDTDPATVHAVFDYLTDDSFDISHADVIRPVLHKVANDVLGRHDLTWGTCYGDAPEAIRTPTGEVCLIDWNGVLHAPLLWDVAEWAATYADPLDQQAFVAACVNLQFINPAEFEHVERLTRLRDARRLRHRAWRLVQAHLRDTRQEDAEEFHRLAARLDVHL